jgi:ubiquinone biosynthesis protein
MTRSSAFIRSRIRILISFFFLRTFSYVRYLFAPKKGKSYRAVLFRSTLERLGTAFVKLGQILALREDLLSEVYRDQLRLLFDDSRPLSFDVIKEQIEKELGRPVEELFYKLEEKPIASASMGQVHVGYLNSYTKVAVKVQRPGVEDELKADFAFLRRIGKLVNLSQPQIWLDVLKEDVTNIINEVIRFTSAELNYESEAAELKFFRQYITSDAYYPKVHDETSSRRILTTEFLEGVNFNKIINETKADPLWFERNGYDRLKIANIFIGTLLQQIFSLGRFQADPHPSNMILMEGGRIGFVDFGITGSLPQEFRDDLLYAILAEIAGEYDFAADITLKYARPTKNTNVLAFKRELFELMTNFRQANISPTTSSFEDKSLGIYVQNLTDLYRKNKLSFVTGFVTYLRSVLVYGNTFTSIFSDLDVIALSFPLYLRIEQKKWIDSLTQPPDLQTFLTNVLKAKIMIDKLIQKEQRKTDEYLFYSKYQREDDARRRDYLTSMIALFLLAVLVLAFSVAFRSYLIFGIRCETIGIPVFFIVLIVAIVRWFKK